MAVDVTKDYLVLNFQEFSDVDPDRVASLNPIAQLFVSADLFGEMYQYALMLRIAHMLKLDMQRGKGMTTSWREGEVSKSHSAHTPQAGEALSLTIYGVMFLELASLKTSGGRVIGMYEATVIPEIE